MTAFVNVHKQLPTWMERETEAQRRREASTVTMVLVEEMRVKSVSPAHLDGMDRSRSHNFKVT